MTDFKIIVNRAPARFQKSGVGYYTSSLIAALRQTELKDRIVYHDFGLGNATVPQAGRALLRRLAGDRLYSRVKVLLYRRKLNQLLSTLQGSRILYHETNSVPVLDLQLPCVTSVHDLSVFKLPDCHPAYRVRFFHDNFRRTLNSDRIVVPTNSIKQELMDTFAVPAEKIRVIAYGRNQFYRPLDPPQGEKAAQECANKRFVLYSGTIEPRKNIENLIRAFALVKAQQDVALVLAGGFEGRHEQTTELPRKLGLKDVYFTGYIPEKDLLRLYNNARVFVYVSWYEGFGFPPVEAMACGLPVVVSRIPSLSEVCADAPLYVDPYSVESIADAILRALEDEQLRRRMRRRGLARSAEFTWDRTAAKMIEVYKEALWPP